MALKEGDIKADHCRDHDHDVEHGEGDIDLHGVLLSLTPTNSKTRRSGFSVGGDGGI